VTPEELKTILEKYNLGECSQEELLIVNRFFKAIENQEIPVFKNESDQHQIGIELKNKIDKAINPEPEIISNIFKFSSIYKFAAAAVVIICLSLGYLFVNNQSFSAKNEIALFQTANGKKQEVVLSDGTKVHLNAGSIFKAPKVFSGTKREVYLEGEAFFEVAKNDKMPFVIISNKLNTQVVGTSFNVKAYPNNKNIEVAVMTGKVKVFDQVSEVYLTPNQKVIYEKASGKLQTQTVSEIANYNAWMNGIMVFEKKSMEEIIRDVSRNYDVEIELVGENIKKCVLNVRFENDSLETVLRILCSYTDAKFIRSGNKIILKGKGC
jgi:transmembrane sensor